jgi:endonuclease/exonuclease/phosphatase (EEP) superfamily protein YafD
MLEPSTLHHKTCCYSCKEHLPDTFSILCWNVHKNNKSKNLAQYLKDKIEKKSLDLLLFQEAIFKNKERCKLPNFNFDAAANIEFGNKFYGVMTASRVESYFAKPYLSECQEVLIGPHKSMLLTSYIFEDKSEVLVLNIHAINFRENRRYHKEIERFFDFIGSYSGAIIVAGDFNSWNKKRLKKLYENAEKLKLKSVSFNNKHYVKSFLGNPLDFIFYKGLELLDASVEKADKFSDHNPLFATFKKV